MTDLSRLGIRIEAHGDRLRYSPRLAVTPDLAERMKAHKSELLEILQSVPEAVLSNRDSGFLKPVTQPQQSRSICRCSGTTWRDVAIHGGQSVRRDCGRCGRFLSFPVWYGKNTGHKDQHLVRYLSG
ncbi:TubC N-terminal docking domain-related protein [Bythopirellula polymerisocia]|uniref:TubC N-terminal docking domain-related protein n=1 Tax=Bythopirellula polymerisocia TaxID=2528003 RepID=UPI0011B71622|nr:hypothetical protein [Bythopirellula polymerisocia]